MHTVLFEAVCLGVILGIIVRRGGAMVASVMVSSYLVVKRCVARVFQHTVSLLFNALHWVRDLSRRDSPVCDIPKSEVHPDYGSDLNAASWSIINETVLACRTQLGLDRHSSHDDLATRLVVAKTCFGILTDKQRFPSLRRTDAERLCAVAREVALTPTVEELQALDICSRNPFAKRRSLARGAWGWKPTTWSEWFANILGFPAGEQYLPPVGPPAF